MINEDRQTNLEQIIREWANDQKNVFLADDNGELLERLSTQTKLIHLAHEYFIHTSNETLALTQAAEWLLDNYYRIQQVQEQIQKDLPITYYRELPKLAQNHPLANYPRIYALAREIVLHTQGQLEAKDLLEILKIYQQVTPLTMGEVWAFPTMLRFCLLESLAQASAQLCGISLEDSVQTPALSFIFEISSANVVAVSISSLHLLNNIDWKDFFEAVNLVEQILRDDPAQIYARMEFTSRNQYRQTVEALAKTAGYSETGVARHAIDLAQKACAEQNRDYTSLTEWEGLFFPDNCHIGYYLLGEGRPLLEELIHFKPEGTYRLQRRVYHHATTAYLSGIGLLTFLLLLVCELYAIIAGSTLAQLLIILLLILTPAISAVVRLVNWTVTHTLPPHVLPRLDFQEGIPETCQTMVVVPSLLSSKGTIQSLIAQLEQHYLRNSDPHLSFALLTDFVDAPQESMPDDDALLAEAMAGIEALNQRYPGQPFYLFHRPRLWNKNEGVWMGWERKRGKLHDFNRLILDDKADAYKVKLGDLNRIPTIRYVITLDADTILPYDSAQRLIGTLAHPLNQAQHDPASNEVIRGYTVLQPRTEIIPTSAIDTRFARIFSSESGVDLYTLAVSDAYQDLFGEGIYAGKGIYEVRSFTRSLDGCVPENSLLSHDLFEGIYGRAGLVSDIILYEEFPPTYLAYARRLERWIRGDWQLLPWLIGYAVPGNHCRRVRLTAIDRWKIIDNLQRSWLAPSFILFFIAGWLWLPGSPFFWTAIGLLLSSLLFFTGMIDNVIHSVDSATTERLTYSLRRYTLRWLLWLAFLPYEAWLATQGIGVTLIRLFITRRHLLQWTTSADTATQLGKGITVSTIFKHTWKALLLSLLTGFLIIIVNPVALIPASPLLVLWLLMPVLTYWSSQPVVRQYEQLDASQIQQLRALARHTWLYFEHFVGPDDNWLPPDNYQESPRETTAHRTSPTNTGMYLLSALAAYDFGFIGTMETAIRLRSTFDTLEKLKRYRGHFYNWLDTSNLQYLHPLYISTVDSGNLAGSLIALRQGCREIPHQPVWRWEQWQGLLDLLWILTETINDIKELSAENTTPLQNHIDDIRQRVESVKSSPDKWLPLLIHLTTVDRTNLEQLIVDLVVSSTSPKIIQNIRVYVQSIRQHLDSMYRAVNLFMPWLSALQNIPSFFVEYNLSPDLQEAWESFQNMLQVNSTLSEITNICQIGKDRLKILESLLIEETPQDNDVRAESIRQALEWCTTLAVDLSVAQMMAESILTTYKSIIQTCSVLFEEMDFTFLFDPKRQVFHIGFNLETGQLDLNAYDLLASEARIASLIAIAKRDVPQSHWLHLARPVTHLEGETMLLSWSGTMFEYLMPPLLMRDYEGTLLAESNAGVVNYQIDYGKYHKVPWGISESGYYAFDPNMNHQYQAFGVPGLGFKRGLTDDLVIAPYASMLAVSFRPSAVMQNFEKFRELNMMSRYGLYEAIDYTHSRLMLGQYNATVYSHMAHHQGMIMIALLNHLEDARMINRFHADASIQSVELLLQEQIPQQLRLQYPHEADISTTRTPRREVDIYPWDVALDTPLPLVHCLANGRYTTLITSNGGGYSQWRDVALTRWRADTTRDDWGYWLYVQDQESGALWSATMQPAGKHTRQQSVRFHPHMVEFLRHDHEIALNVEIVVAPDEDVEVRRVRVTNKSDQMRHLRLTGYGEVVLASPDEDRRHQAFVKLFVESEYLENLNALLFRRRPRSSEESPVFLLHMLVLELEQTSTPTYETDRARFLGRGNTVHHPAGLYDPDGLSQTVGATLDPVMVLSQDIELEAHASIQLAYITIAGKSRTDIINQAERYRSWFAINHVFTQAKDHVQREMWALDLTVSALKYVQQLLSLLIYPHHALRAEPGVLAANNLGQSDLWRFGISGDYPVLLVEIQDAEQDALLDEILRAHTYWRRAGFKFDLVILNQEESSYGQSVQGYIRSLIIRRDSETWLNKRGGIFILRRDQMNDEEYILLQTVARIILYSRQGNLEKQLANLLYQPSVLPELRAMVDATTLTEDMPPLVRPDNLLFDNGFGGFSPDGREYIIYLEPGDSTPAPWINVISNPQLGSCISESNLGTTWAINSGENRLTPWNNDPVSDSPAEALYIRDEETVEIWSPTPQPAPANAPYLIQHGAGYSIFTHHSHGLKQELRVFVDATDPIKILQLRVENSWQRPRRITVTYYAEWVLGTTRATTQSYIIPVYEPAIHAVLARNPYSMNFSKAVAFVAASRAPHGLTADRTEFLGQLGTYQSPAALKRIGLDNCVQAGLDPCVAIQLHLELPPGGSEEVYFMIGQTEDRMTSQQLIEEFQNPDRVALAWQSVQNTWDKILETVIVDTPDTGLNLLLNRWLVYQNLSSRVWGRSAFYQSSGAFGFRDQLQDMMALLHSQPDLAREHILYASRHQFEEGDVLHWWHPPAGHGVRTRISDDLLWLPYVTAQYITTTGDIDILNETVPFLHGSPLAPAEDERYAHYPSTQESFTIYEHCWRAIQAASTSGRHGLPLMGSGDWNDGMNRVGIEGQGESIWLGWFLYSVLISFAELAQLTNHSDHALKCQEQATALQEALEESAWDGDWYRRAYFDDGAPLGSVQNNECRIDALGQSWSVLSGAGNPERSAEAMQSLLEYLVRWDDRLILLLAPPFDKTRKDPGYIKGYVPGIRENGGQYTHAALWTIWAFASLGQGDLVYKLFQLINPIYRADTHKKAEHYRVEPYVISADVYGIEPHVGRGGWTWYTGSGGWMYRLGIEMILGIRRRGTELAIEPCIPGTWKAYTITYHYGQTPYHIHVENPDGVNQGVQSVIIDGEISEGRIIPLVDDRQDHQITIRLGNITAEYLEAMETDEEAK